MTQESTGAQVGGALIGGTIGLISGSGQSRSNRALRAVGGGFAGQQIGRVAGRSQAFEYTILLGGTSTIRMVTDEAGLRVGDCVAVERGAFNNLRLVNDSPVRCADASERRQAPPAATATPVAVGQADACVTAKEQLLAAETDEAFDRAERRVRLLCAD